jgi:hypothetical protein
MTLQKDLKDLDKYEKALKTQYPNRSEFELLQIAVSLMNIRTVEDGKRFINMVTK